MTTFEKKCCRQVFNHLAEFYFCGALPPTPSPEALPPGPDAFVLNPTSQLDIGYHWLAYLNQVCKNLQVPSSLQMFITISTMTQKLKNTQKKLMNYKIRSEHCASFF